MEPIFDDDFRLSGSKTTSGSLSNVTQYVNPQYTDKRYAIGFMTPESSPTDATPRRESFALSENRTSYFSSSSGSSFMSHSGCGTPTQSTPGSSASNSRRQSMLLPDSQYCSSAIPSSPSNRPRRPRGAAHTDQYPLQDFSPRSYNTSTDPASLITDSATACTPGGDFPMAIDDFYGKAPEHWQNCGFENDTSLFHAQIDEPPSLSPDLVAAFSRNTHTLELGQTLFRHTQPSIFDQPSSQHGAEAYNLAADSSPIAPSLAPAFVYSSALSNAATAERSHLGSSHLSKRSRGKRAQPYTLSPPSDDVPECNHGASRIAKNRIKKPKQGRIAETGGIACGNKPQKCEHYIDDGNGHIVPCPNAFDRPEHLRRHTDSKHRGSEVLELPCAFAECWDRKKKEHRKILARPDNLKAHYKETHFRYGNSEKSGKNERKSMKVAHEMGLSSYDLRWELLVENKMDVNHEIPDFLHVWKMLGYSIRETRDMRVKDVRPDWKPEEETLQKFDPRWIALWNQTLSFDQAMNVGEHMKESKAQGLLGVTMLETEEMGIKHLDVRWVQLDKGRMSVEQSEMLGVKERNPVWIDLVNRRKARGWVEKF